jgi:hypothetical protein
MEYSRCPKENLHFHANNGHFENRASGEVLRLEPENNKNKYLSTLIDRVVFNGELLEQEENKNYRVFRGRIKVG